jgi:hypothetical protein
MNNRPTLRNKAASNRGNIGNRSNELKRIGIKRDDDSMFGELLRHGVDDDFEPAKECIPTEHPPGSVGKIVVLALRLMNGQCLYHKDDERICATKELENEMVDFVKGRKTRKLHSQRNRAKCH